MKRQYSEPTVTDYGHIAEVTLQTPGRGTKSRDTSFLLDKFGEFSHPAETSGS
jgi:hypothetical protein